MKIRHLLSFISFAAIVAGAVFYIASLGVRAGPPAERVNVSMQVPDVNGLVPDSNVLLRGVPVGKVTGIDTTTSTATVHFYIDKRYEIPVDSEVRLENLSALGESYIGLMPRTDRGPMFTNGLHVAAANVVQPASISELATNVVRVLNQLGPDQLTRVVAEADKALPDRQTVLPNLARASVLMRAMVAGLHGRGSELMTNAQTLLQNASFVGVDLAAITPYVSGTATGYHDLAVGALDVMKNSGAPESIRNSGKLLDRLQAFLDTRAGDFKVIADATQPYIQGIASSLMGLDTGQLLDSALKALPEDGTLTLHVTTSHP